MVSKGRDLECRGVLRHRLISNFWRISMATVVGRTKMLQPPLRI